MWGKKVWPKDSVILIHCIQSFNSGSFEFPGLSKASGSQVTLKIITSTKIWKLELALGPLASVLLTDRWRQEYTKGSSSFQFPVFLFCNFLDISRAFPFYLYSKVNRSHLVDSVKELKAGVAVNKNPWWKVV